MHNEAKSPPKIGSSDNATLACLPHVMPGPLLQTLLVVFDDLYDSFILDLHVVQSRVLKRSKKVRLRPGKYSQVGWKQEQPYLLCFAPRLHYWKSRGQVMCYRHKGTLDWQCLIWSYSRLLHLPKGPRMELGSRTSAFWLQGTSCIAFCLYGRWKTQFRSQ